MNTKFLGILALPLGAALIWYAGCGRYVSGFPCPRITYAKTDAMQIAWERLQKLCNSKQIRCSEFAVLSVGKSNGVPWVIDYSSENMSRENFYYFFRTTIDECGIVETAWQRYEKSPKDEKPNVQTN